MRSIDVELDVDYRQGGGWAWEFGDLYRRDSDYVEYGTACQKADVTRIIWGVLWSCECCWTAARRSLYWL